MQTTDRGVMVAIGALVVATGCAVAQQRIIPKCFTWGQHPDGVAAPDPMLTNMVAFDAVDPPNHDNPEYTAHLFAQQVKDDLTAGKISVGKFCARGFGLPTDHPDYDCSTCGSMTRLYLEQDRLPGLSDFDPLDTQHTHSFPFLDLALRTNRAYRHPFLVNALADADPSTPGVQAPPAKAWFQRFAAEYDRLRTQDAQFLGLPTPERVYIDSESIQQAHNNNNALYMLWYISTNNPTINYNGTTAGAWNGIPVPGDPYGRTLAQIFTDARTAYDIADIHDPNKGIDRTLGHFDKRNRPFMLVWAEVQGRALDAVYKNCVYDVAHAAWGAECRTGNYGDARYDGVLDSTGWFMDRDCPGPHRARPMAATPVTRTTPTNAAGSTGSGRAPRCTLIRTRRAVRIAASATCSIAGGPAPTPTSRSSIRVASAVGGRRMTRA